MIVTKEFVSTGYSLRCDRCQTFFPAEADAWYDSEERLLVNAETLAWFISEDAKVSLCKNCKRKLWDRFVHSPQFLDMVKEA